MRGGLARDLDVAPLRALEDRGDRFKLVDEHNLNYSSAAEVI